MATKSVITKIRRKKMAEAAIQPGTVAKITHIALGSGGVNGDGTVIVPLAENVALRKRMSESLILHQPRLQIHPMSTPSSLRKMSLLVHSSVRWHSLMRMEMWWRSLISLQKVRMRQR